MAPDWDNLAKFLRKRRRELARQMRVELNTPEALRRTTLDVPPSKPDRNTLRNAELGIARPDLETFLYLAPIYRVSYLDLISALLPASKYNERRDEVAEFVAALPWLTAVVKGLVRAPRPVQEMIAKMFDADVRGERMEVAG